MVESALRTDNLTKEYTVSAGIFRGKKKLKAVNGVSLNIPKGSILGLVGESGCGKTTIAKMILGLEKPSNGELFIDGNNILSMNYKDVAQIIKPAFQDPY